MARPSSFKPEFVTQAEKLCKLGATDQDIAAFFEVSVATIYRWKATFPEFCEALKRGKEVADDLVEQSLFRRATGYSHEAVKIITVSDGGNSGSHVEQVPYTEHYPPDTTAMIFWLKNRRPEQWRDARDLNVKKSPLDNADTATLEALAEALEGGEDGASERDEKAPIH